MVSSLPAAHGPAPGEEENKQLPGTQSLKSGGATVEDVDSILKNVQEVADLVKEATSSSPAGTVSAASAAGKPVAESKKSKALAILGGLSKQLGTLSMMLINDIVGGLIGGMTGGMTGNAAMRLIPV